MAVIGLNSNLSSLTTQRRLADHVQKLSRSFERLSSGLRINKASDDAAGLSIATSLQLDSRVYSQGIRNVNDGVSLLNIAEGATTQLSNIVIRIRELATQSANGTLSLNQRSSLHHEANALVDEFNRIVSATTFNGRNLLDSSFGSLAVQAGYGQLGQVSFGLAGQLARSVGEGTLQNESYTGTTLDPTNTVVGDFNSDGKMDAISAVINGGGLELIAPSMGNGNGTFTTLGFQAVIEGMNQLRVGDINNDGKLDLLAGNTTSVTPLLGNGDGTFSVGTTHTISAGSFFDFELGDLNNDGNLDVVELTSSTLKVRLGNGNGTFQGEQSMTHTATPSTDVVLADFNGDGVLDAATTAQISREIGIFFGTGTGSFVEHAVFLNQGAAATRGINSTDFNNDGHQDLIVANGSSQVEVYLGAGDGSFALSQLVSTGAGTYSIQTADLNGDGYKDIATANFTGTSITIALGNGDGTFQTGVNKATSVASSDIAIGDFNSDGVPDVIANLQSAHGFGLYLSNTDQSTAMPHLNLNTAADARATMDVADATLLRVLKELGAIGATQSRLATALNNLAQSNEGSLQAASRILDVDTAEEAANLTRERIAQQAASAILGQANQLPSLALLLLR